MSYTCIFHVSEAATQLAKQLGMGEGTGPQSKPRHLGDSDICEALVTPLASTLFMGSKGKPKENFQF